LTFWFGGSLSEISGEQKPSVEEKGQTERSIAAEHPSAPNAARVVRRSSLTSGLQPHLLPGKRIYI